MVLEKFDIRGPVVVDVKKFGDSRGYFFESYNQEAFNALTKQSWNFVQDNQSLSAKRGTLRGLHCQLNPKPQGKLVRVIQGAIQDVAVDIRHGSPSFGQWVECELTGDNNRQLWIPPGFLHGFCTLTDDVIVAYKCTETYDPNLDRSVAWNDPLFNIRWQLNGMDPILSDKDSKAAPLADQTWFSYED